MKDLFDQTKSRHLLVVEDGSLFGVISDRDLLKSTSTNISTVAATTKELAALNGRAHQIMTRKPTFLNENPRVKDAIAVFNQNEISCIPIVNDIKMPVGILSWRVITQELVRDK